MAKTYFVGGELDAFDTNASLSVWESTNGLVTNFSRGTVRTDGASSRFYASLIDPATGAVAPATGTVWTHFMTAYTSGSSSGSGVSVFQILNGNGVPIVRQIASTPANNYMWQYWNGSAWVNLGSVLILSNSNTTMDIKITFGTGTTGSVEAYANNTLVGAVTGIDTLTGMVNQAKLDFWSNGSSLSYIAGYQQVLVADYSTIGHTVRRRTPTGNGTNTAWAGDYTGVDEFPYSDGDGVSTAAVGASESFTAAALPATAGGHVIKAVAITTRSRADADSPTRTVRGTVRVGGTDYVSPAMQGQLTPGFSPRMAIWDNNPATGAPWVDISVVNGEFGLKSDT